MAEAGDRVHSDSMQGSTGTGQAKQKKLQRVKAYQWLCATDACLRGVSGRGWKYFHQPEDTKVPSAEWPTISYASDQGSDTQSAMNWLLAHRVAIMKVNDPNHRVSNDTDLALGDEGLNALVSLVSLVMGTDQGPWGKGRWHQTMKEVSIEYTTVADADSCPIFNQLLPRIAMDLDEGSLQHDPAWKETAWEALKFVYEQKELRVPGTRWFDFVDRAGTYIRKWHSKLTLLNFHLISTGVFENSGTPPAPPPPLTGPTRPARPAKTAHGRGT